jgi:hypothetical protein
MQPDRNLKNLNPAEEMPTSWLQKAVSPASAASATALHNALGHLGPRRQSGAATALFSLIEMPEFLARFRGKKLQRLKFAPVRNSSFFRH